MLRRSFHKLSTVCSLTIFWSSTLSIRTRSSEYELALLLVRKYNPTSSTTILAKFARVHCLSIVGFLNHIVIYFVKINSSPTPSTSPPLPLPRNISRRWKMHCAWPPGIETVCNSLYFTLSSVFQPFIHVPHITTPNMVYSWHPSPNGIGHSNSASKAIFIAIYTIFFRLNYIFH